MLTDNGAARKVDILGNGLLRTYAGLNSKTGGVTVETAGASPRGTSRGTLLCLTKSQSTVRAAAGVTIADGGLAVHKDSTTTTSLEVHADSTSFTGNVVLIKGDTASGTAYNLLQVMHRCCCPLCPQHQALNESGGSYIT